MRGAFKEGVGGRVCEGVLLLFAIRAAGVLVDWSDSSFVNLLHR